MCLEFFLSSKPPLDSHRKELLEISSGKKKYTALTVTNFGLLKGLGNVLLNTVCRVMGRVRGRYGIKCPRAIVTQSPCDDGRRSIKHVYFSRTSGGKCKKRIFTVRKPCKHTSRFNG